MEGASVAEIASNETVLTSECQMSDSSYSSEESAPQSYFRVRDSYLNGDSSFSKIALNPSWNSFDEIVGEEVSMDSDPEQVDDGRDEVTPDYDDVSMDASSMDTFNSRRKSVDASVQDEHIGGIKRKRGRGRAKKEEETEAAGLDYEMLMAYRIVKHLMSDNNKAVNVHFMEEVKKKECKDYHKVIKQPMWLKKVLEQLLGGEYNSITEVIRDVRLVLENCYRYYGRRHPITKKGLKMEMMLEQRLALLPRDMRDKTTIEATSSHLVSKNSAVGDEEGTRTSSRRHSSNNVSLGETSLLSSAVWNETKILAEETRRRQTVERRSEKEAAYQNIVDWEANLLDQQEMKSMWELPQIGQFLYLSQLALNIPEVPQYELERIFAMPRESTLLAQIMTSLLCKTRLRSKIDHFPAMPYRIWDKWLRRKMDSFYKVFHSKDRNTVKVFEILGIEPDFFLVIGDKNPLENKSFHELSFQHRIWLVKALCDFTLHSQRPVQDAIAENPMEDQRDYILGTDRHDYTYLHFPQFCGPDLRIYKRAKLARFPLVNYPPLQPPPPQSPPATTETSPVQDKAGKNKTKINCSATITKPESSKYEDSANKPVAIVKKENDAPHASKEEAAVSNKDNDTSKEQEAMSVKNDKDGEDKPETSSKNEEEGENKSSPLSSESTELGEKNESPAKKTASRTPTRGRGRKNFATPITSFRSTRLREKQLAVISSPPLEPVKESPKHEKASKERVEEEVEPVIEPSPKFEMVVDSLESLRALITSLEEAKNNKTTRAAVQNEAELLENLNCLLKELEPWETKLMQSAKRGRCRLKKQYDDYWRKFNRGIENTGEGTIWDSEPEKSEPEAAPSDNESDSSSSSSDESEVDVRSSSGQPKSKKRRVEEIGEEVQQEMFEDAVCTRERLKNAKKFLRKLKSSHRNDSKETLSSPAKAKENADTRKTNYIDTTARLAKGQYEWETRRQTLLSSFHKIDHPGKDQQEKLCMSPPATRTIHITHVHKSTHLQGAGDVPRSHPKVISPTQQKSKSRVPCYSPRAIMQASVENVVHPNSTQHLSPRSFMKQLDQISVPVSSPKDDKDPLHLTPVSLLQVPVPATIQNNHHVQHQRKAGLAKMKPHVIVSSRNPPSSRPSTQTLSSSQRLVQVPSSSKPRAQPAEVMHFRMESSKPNKASIPVAQQSTFTGQSQNQILARAQQVVTSHITKNLPSVKESSNQAPSVLLIPIMDQYGNKVYIRVMQNGKGASASTNSNKVVNAQQVPVVSANKDTVNNQVSPSVRVNTTLSSLPSVQTSVISNIQPKSPSITTATTNVLPVNAMISKSLSSQSSGAMKQGMIQTLQASTSNALAPQSVCTPVSVVPGSSVLLSRPGTSPSVTASTPAETATVSETRNSASQTSGSSSCFIIRAVTESKTTPTVHLTSAKSRLTEPPPLGPITYQKSVTVLSESTPLSCVSPKKLLPPPLAPISNTSGENKNNTNSMQPSVVSATLPVVSSSAVSLPHTSVISHVATSAGKTKVPLLSFSKPHTSSPVLSTLPSASTNSLGILNATPALGNNCVSTVQNLNHVTNSVSTITLAGVQQPLNSSLISVPTAGATTQITIPSSSAAVMPQVGTNLLPSGLIRQPSIRVIASNSQQSPILVRPVQGSIKPQTAQVIGALSNAPVQTIVSSPLQPSRGTSGGIIVHQAAPQPVISKILPSSGGTVMNVNAASVAQTVVNVQPSISIASGTAVPQTIMNIQNTPSATQRNVVMQSPYTLTTTLVPGSSQSTSQTVLQTVSHTQPVINNAHTVCQGQSNVPQVVCFSQQNKNVSLTQSVSTPVESSQPPPALPVSNQRPIFFLSNNGQLVQLNLPPSQVNLILSKKKDQ